MLWCFLIFWARWISTCGVIIEVIQLLNICIQSLDSVIRQCDVDIYLKRLAVKFHHMVVPCLPESIKAVNLSHSLMVWNWVQIYLQMLIHLNILQVLYSNNTKYIHMGHDRFLRWCLPCLFHLFPFHNFLFQLSTFLFLNGLVDIQFELLFLAPDLLQLSFPLSLQVWILKWQIDQKLTIWPICWFQIKSPKLYSL